MDEKTDHVVLGPYIEYLEEQEGKWRIEDVSSEAFSSKFIQIKEEVPNFGFTQSAYWFRFRLFNRTDLPRKLMLEIPYPVLDHIEYYIQKNRSSFEKHTVGDIYPYGNKVVRHYHFIFPLLIAQMQGALIYLRVQTKGSLQVPLHLRSIKEFVAHTQDEQLFYGILMGFLVVIVLYNLFLFIATRDRIYLFYMLFVMSVSLYEASFLGLSQEYLWPNNPWIAEKVYIWSALGVCLFVVLFSIKFMNLPQLMPVWNRIFKVYIVFCVAGIIASSLLPYRFMILFLIACVISGVIICVFVSIFALIKGFKSARYYFAAWAIFLAGILLFVLNKFGLIPRSTLTENGHLIGLGLNVILLSLALADRINLLRQEKEMAQREALDVQLRSTETLEQQVQERTQELKQAYEQLAEHDRLKSRFFANVSHELRTPLTLILTPLERLLSCDLAQNPEGTRQQLRSMAGNTQRLLRLVNQLLDFSRLESGAATVAFELRDIRVMVAALVHGFMPYARNKELKLDIRVPDELPMVYVDPSMLEKSISNLLSNACKFTEHGGTVLVRISSDDKAVKIAIIDSGIGIAQEDLPKIFERFRQADSSAARRFEGTGIGLALSKELVELMGGTLEANSDLGVGSTFTVTLLLGKDHIQDPSLIRSETSEAENISHARAAAIALAAEAGLRRKKTSPSASADAEEKNQEDPSRPLLLVVEDNADMRALVTDICHEDFRVIEAENGRIGLEKIKEHHPALVVLDVMMPEMDGHEVLRQVRADPATTSLPVIMLTAKAGPEMKLEGLESGADDYLSKPFESRELLARARNLVRLQKQERQLREVNVRLQQEVVEQSTALEQARALQRYLPPEVARTVIEKGTPVQVGQERHRLTVFRLELRGFKQLLLHVDPEDLASMINVYLSEMVEVAFSHGATVDKLIRDTVVGFMGAPSSEGPVKDALRCAHLAIDMWEHAREVCGRWKRLLKGCGPPAPTMVLSSGHATVGNFGSSNRLEYTAMGGPLDEAAEILPLIEPGEVLCSQSTWALIQGEIEGELHGEVTVPGASQAVKLYRIAGSVEDAEVTAPATQTLVKPPRAGQPGQPPGSLSKGMVLAERYEIVSPLGEGGMGSVYKARDLKLGSDVALKLLKPHFANDNSRRTRQYREVRLAQLVSHRNVARIYDLQTWEGFEFISMEFIQGQTLSERLQAGGTFSTAEGSNVLSQLCAGLAAAHGANIVHRDLKPSNIMIADKQRVVIMDFGIARWGSTLQQTGSETIGMVGSPHYMAPEQFEDSQVDHRADIYALGVVAYEMFTGQKPFKAKNTLALAYKHTYEPPPDPVAINPDIPLRFVAVIMRCLEKSPAKRFGSVVEIASLLEVARSEQNTVTSQM